MREREKKKDWSWFSRRPQNVLKRRTIWFQRAKWPKQFFNQGAAASIIEDLPWLLPSIFEQRGRVPRPPPPGSHRQHSALFQRLSLRSGQQHHTGYQERECCVSMKYSSIRMKVKLRLKSEGINLVKFVATKTQHRNVEVIFFPFLKSYMCLEDY